jgi:hypothetical protein
LVIALMQEVVQRWTQEQSSFITTKLSPTKPKLSVVGWRLLFKPKKRYLLW